MKRLLALLALLLPGAAHAACSQYSQGAAQMQGYPLTWVYGITLGPGGTPGVSPLAGASDCSLLTTAEAAAAGLGTDESANPPSTLTQLASGTVVHAGQLYVMNESANPLQLWLQGATAPVLIAPGAGANNQGADWPLMLNMPWFKGTYTINGTSGSQFFANSN